MRSPEYRSYDTGQLEFRGKAGAGATLIGYPIVYGLRSTLIGGWFYEQVMAGAPDESMVADDVKFTYNHGAMLARSVPAADHHTLRLTVDDHGQRAEADLPDTQTARDVFIMVERGDITGMSFAFRTLGEDETWWSETEDGIPLRSIKRLRQFDASVVDDPAYTDTGVWAEGALRSVASHSRKTVDEVRSAIEKRAMSTLWTPEDLQAPHSDPVSPAAAAAPARSLMAARLRLLDVDPALVIERSTE